MRLHLSGDSFLNSLYTSDAGQTLYKVESPHTGPFSGRSSTISRVVPYQRPSRDAEEEGGEEGLRDQFAEVVRIDWKVIKFSTLHYPDGRVVSGKEYFRKEGFGWYGR